MIEKPSHRERIVIRKKGRQHTLAVGPVDRLATGCRHACQKKHMFRILAFQRSYEWHARADFADGNGMHPDQGRGSCDLVATESLAKSF